MATAPTKYPLGDFRLFHHDLLIWFLAIFAPGKAVATFGRLSKRFRELVQSTDFRRRSLQQWYYNSRCKEKKFETFRSEYVTRYFSIYPSTPLSQAYLYEALWDEAFLFSCYECAAEVPCVQFGKEGKKTRLFRHPFTNQTICRDCIATIPYYMVIGVHILKSAIFGNHAFVWKQFHLTKPLEPLMTRKQITALKKKRMFHWAIFQPGDQRYVTTHDIVWIPEILVKMKWKPNSEQHKFLMRLRSTMTSLIGF
jgi:hypothetical protein